MATPVSEQMPTPEIGLPPRLGPYRAAVPPEHIDAERATVPVPALFRACLTQAGSCSPASGMACSTSSGYLPAPPPGCGGSPPTAPTYRSGSMTACPPMRADGQPDRVAEPRDREHQLRNQARGDLHNRCGVG